jgi:cytidyltransferase-like protein
MISGSFDLLNNRHIARLKKAKQLGDFFYVGVGQDETVHNFRGHNFPLLSLHGRVLMFLACNCSFYQQRR